MEGQEGAAEGELEGVGTGEQLCCSKYYPSLVSVIARVFPSARPQAAQVFAFLQRQTCFGRVYCKGFFSPG